MICYWRNTALVILISCAVYSASAQRNLVTECAHRKDHRVIEICRLAAEQNADDPKVLKLLAKTLIEHGAFAEASEVQGTIAQLRPDDWAAQYDYAGTLGFVRRYQDAIIPIRRAIALRPNYIPSYQAAALIFTMMGRHADAAVQTRKAAELGSAVAMFDMVRYYVEGLGVEKSDAEAFRWTKQAAESGHLLAMREMIEIFLEGRYGQIPNDTEAINWATRHRAAKEIR